MKLFWIVLIVLLFAALIDWVREAQDPFHVLGTLPLLNPRPSGLWHVAGLLMIVITAWGIRRLKNSDDE